MPSNGANGSNGTKGVNTSNYIRWDADGVEKVPPGEAEDVQAVADMINNHRHMYSG
jgi:hypothetical protein